MLTLRTYLKRYPTVIATIAAVVLLGLLALFVHSQFGSDSNNMVDERLSGSTVGLISATTAASSQIDAPAGALPPSIATVLAYRPADQQSAGQPSPTARVVMLPPNRGPSWSLEEFRLGLIRRDSDLSSGRYVVSPQSVEETTP